MSVTTAQRRRIYKRDGEVCFYCKQQIAHHPWIKGVARPSWASSVDHRIPRSRGGTDEDSNLVACCHECNIAKGSMTDAEFLEFLSPLSPEETPSVAPVTSDPSPDVRRAERQATGERNG
jgi:5-methylcytosine-specific restriction endonuclease McrA